MSYQMRVEVELEELTARRDRLFRFITDSPVYKGLANEEQQLLRRQWIVMCEYVSILKDRIAYFKGENGQSRAD